MDDEIQKDAFALLAERAVDFWRSLLRQNVFYLASALLMLAGCYMVCIPYLFQRQLGGLFVLLGVINAYELMVIIACCFIMRRTVRSREPLPLVLVELLFLFDVTFTVNACLPLNYRQGTLVAGASMLLGIVKLFTMEVGSRRSLFKGMRVFLIGTMALLYSFQAVIVHASGMASHREIATFFVWLAFGVLPLLLPKTTALQETADGWWAAPAFKRAVAALAFVALAAQLIGQSWVYNWPVVFSHVLPFLFALIAAFPFFSSNFEAWNKVRMPLAVGLAFVECVLDTESPQNLQVFGFTLGSSMAQAGMFFAAACSALMWLRERREWQANLLCLFAAVAILGGNPRVVQHTLFTPNVLTLLLLLPVCSFWLFLHPTFARSLAVMSMLLALISQIVVQRIPDGNTAWFCVQFWPACAFLISVLLSNSRVFRAGLAALVVGIGVYSFSDTEFVNVICFTISGGALAAGMLLLAFRPYAVLLSCYILAGFTRFYGLSIESVPFNWGWLTIAAAFALFALAFSISRRELRQSESAP